MEYFFDRIEKKNDKNGFEKHQKRKLHAASPHQTMNSTEYHQSDGICDRIGEQSFNSRAPVVNDVLC